MVIKRWPFRITVFQFCPNQPLPDIHMVLSRVWILCSSGALIATIRLTTRGVIITNNRTNGGYWYNPQTLCIIKGIIIIIGRINPLSVSAMNIDNCCIDINCYRY